MRKVLTVAALLACCAVFFASCEGSKAPETKEEEVEEGRAPIELFITSCESTDSLLCARDACLSSDCGIEDYYFTKKGNVIQRVSCVNEEDALWVIGKYRISDSGIVCQMDRVYIVPLKNKSVAGGPVDYDAGQFTNLDNKDPYMLLPSTCEGVLYTKRYTERIKELQKGRGGPMAFGRVYSENKDWEKRMLEEMRKVKELAEL